MILKVRIHKTFNNDKGLKAVCSVTMDEMFTVHGVRIIKTEKGFFASMPYETYKDADGVEQRKDIFHPITSDARHEMENAVIAAYEEKLAADAETVTEETVTA